MTIEDKAKAYDEALKRAKKWLNAPNVDKIPTYGNRVIEEIFPELKESEDEKIKKSLIHLVHLYGGEFGMIDANTSVEKAVSWLEKQGEQKPIIEMKSPEESLNIDSKTYNEIVNDCIFGEDKPKFKVGDWILIDNPCQIESIKNNGNYIVKYCDAEETHLLSRNFCDSHFHLWTIQNAKDGDVLAFDNETIVIFKDLYNTTTFHSYCYVEKGVFSISKDDMPDWWAGKWFHPATKEQRDILFEKMKEAGYEWDTEKKELKKIEPIDDYKGLTNFERAVADVCIGWIGKEPGWKQYIIDNSDVLLKIAIKKFNSVQDAFLEPKPAYLEEFINELSKQFPDVSFAKLSRIAVRVAKWAKPTDEEMKELLRTEYEKGRADTIAEMQKSTWSEEDNKWIESLIQTFEDGYLEGFNQLKSYGIIDWLKSLKERL